jgi:hypothetical protein
VAGSDQIVSLRQLDSVEPLQRQNPPRGAPPVDLWDKETGLGDHFLAQL